MDDLRKTKAKVRFVSFEPLLEHLGKISLRDIDWVIVGGESGRNHRKLEKKWVISLRDQCKRRSIPFFFKQWGGAKHSSGGRLLDGKTYDEYPIIK